MRVTSINVGSVINVFLMIASLVFLWYSFFYFSDRRLEKLSISYFDTLLLSTESYHLYLATFASMLLFVSVFGYMSLTENQSIMIVTEMILLLVMIAIQVISIYYVYAEKTDRQKKIASYMYKGVVLPHKTSKNYESNNILELTYNEINGNKWKCCGIYSWKDAESFRPKDCCPRGYIGIPGNGTCNENYGPYVKTCIEMRNTIVLKEIGRYAIVIIAMILTEFFGLMLCGMVLFIVVEDGRQAFHVGIKNLFLDVGRRF